MDTNYGFSTRQNYCTAPILMNLGALKIPWNARFEYFHFRYDSNRLLYDGKTIRKSNSFFKSVKIINKVSVQYVDIKKFHSHYLLNPQSATIPCKFTSVVIT